MTKNEKKVREYINKWKPKLFLDGYIFHIEIKDDNEDGDYAEVKVNAMYRDGNILPFLSVCLRKQMMSLRKQYYMR